MPNVTNAANIHDAIRLAVGRENKQQAIQERKGAFHVFAPAFFWGPWVEVYSQFGVTGPDPNNHVTRVSISFNVQGRNQSSFDVEIEGGDNSISQIGPGSTLVTISGNVATALRFRAKSHSLALELIVFSRS